LLIGMLQHWVSIVVVGGLLALVWRSGLLTAASNIVRRPLASLGSGLLVLVGGFVAVIVVIILLIILAISLGSLGLGGLTAVTVISLLLTDVFIIFGLVLGATLVAAALLSLAIGRVLLQGRAAESIRNVLIWLALGAVLYAIVAALPVIGGLVQFVVALLGLGAIGLAFWNSRRRTPAPPPPAEAVAA
jgi:hypothetical protein